MNHTIEDLLTRLTDHAAWCDANEWEIPITMGNDIREAIATIKRYKAIEKTTTLTFKADLCGNEMWEFAGTNLTNPQIYGIIWRCKRCGFRRIAGCTPPYYNCPECSGRDAKGEDQQSTKGDSGIWQRKEK